MAMLLRGRTAAAGFCAAVLMAGTTTGAEAGSFKAWPVPFNGTNGNFSVAPLYLGQDGLLYGTTNQGGNTAGTVFSISQAGALTSLYAFRSPPDGESPDGGVAVENNGTIYGSTYAGGPESLDYPGTIYTISPQGGESILYNFCQKTNCTDGVNPNSTLVADNRKSGYLYGTTHGGGSNGAGTLFRIGTDGKMKPSLYAFCHEANCADGSTPIGAPFVINSGQAVVYGAASAGGANGYGVVYLFEPDSGVYNDVYDLDYTHGAYPQGGVILDKKSNIIGVAGGGATNNGVVYKVAPYGKPKALYIFGGGTDGAAPIGELVQDPAGNLYGVTAGGGAEGQGTVYELSPQGVETILHSFDFATDGGSPQAGLYGVYTKKGLTLYGTTTVGGQYGYGAVFKVVP